eukprot:12913514-Prorocentrum_lima.AAC.1
MDISAAFLKGMTFKEIACEAGDTLRTVQFDFPPADVWILRKLAGMGDYDNCLEILDLLKAMFRHEVEPVSPRDLLPTRSHRPSAME